MSQPKLSDLSEERRALVARLARGEAVLGEMRVPGIERTGATSYRVSKAQERVWFAHHLTADPVFTIRYLEPIPSGEDEDDLRARLAWVLEHQAALRTTFRETPDGVWADVHPDAPPVEVLDLRHLPAGAARAQFEEFSAAANEHRFDVARDRLLRQTLVYLPGGDRQLVTAVHHLVCDVTSLAIAKQQLTEPAPAPPAISYADYAIWSRGESNAARLEGELAVWRERLEGAPPPLQVLSDKPRRGDTTAKAAVHSRRLDERAGSALRRAARSAGVSEFTFLFAAFAEVLAAWSDEQEIVVSIPVDGRVRGELTDLIGLFTNTLILRVDTPAGAPFRARLKTAHRVLRDALSRQETPIQDVLRVLRPTWRESVTEPPILFNSFRIPEHVPAENHLPASCQYELCVWAIDRDTAFDVQFIYHEDLFEPRTIQLFAAQFVETVQRACERLDRPAIAPASGAALRSPTIRQPERTVPGAFAEMARADPSRVAVTVQGSSLTYSQLAEAGAAIAAELRGRGIAPGSHVTVTTDRSTAAVVAMVGVLQAACVYVPIPPDTPPQRRRWVLEDCDAAAMISGDRDGLVVEALRPSHAPLAPARVLPSSAAYCVYTSGSTGRPKGVVVAHDGAVAHVRAVGASLGIARDDRVLQFHGHGFDVAIEHMFFSLVHGATLVMRGDDVWSPADFPRRLAQEGVTIAALPTAYWHEVAAAPADAWHGHDLSALRVVVPGGEALSPAAVAAWHERAPAHVRLVNAYGPTEALMTATHADVPAGVPDRARAPLGGPLAGRDLWVLDTRLERVPGGALGELYIGGDLLADGYHRASARTAAVFVPDPFSSTPGTRLYKTGDLVRCTASGDLEFVGRRDGQVKLRGVRIETGEVEAALRAHPAVAQAAVAHVAAEDPYLAAWVVGGDRVELPGAGVLRAFLAERLPAEMVPRVIIERRELPKTDGGKIDRRALASEQLARPRIDRGGGDDSIEAVVASTFATALDLDAVAAQDNFFSLGGHSLLAVEVATRLSGQLGRTVGLIDLLERPTPAGLAAVIRERGDHPLAADAIRRRPLAIGDAVELAPFQEAIWFLSRITTAASYTVPLLLEFEGPLDVERLEGALRGLVERHTVLRYGFADAGGRPKARLLPAEVALERRAVAEDTLVEVLEHLAAEPIDLADGPLRAVLVSAGPTSHFLYLGIHHAACDGASVELILDQLLAEYETPGSTAEPKLQYSDYVAWVDSHAEQQAGQLDFWRAHLDGVQNLELPSDRPRPALVDFSGGHLLVEFEEALAERIAGFARENATTVFTVVLGAWEALIAGWAGQEDFCVGVPMSRRNHPDLAGVVGPVLTTLPVRARLGGDPSFADLVRLTQAELAECYAAADVSFERIVEAVAVGRDPSRTPLFQTLVSWEGRRPSVTSDAFVATPHQIGTGAAKTDLVLLLNDADGRLEGVVEYATALFDAVTAERLAAALPTLLAAAMAAPDTPLSRLPRVPGTPAARQPPSAPGDAPRDDETPFVPPRTEAERVLEGIFAGALMLDGVGIHDDFFLLGGNSLSATEVATYVTRVFQVDLPVTAVFETPTIAGLSGTLTALAPSPDHVERVAAIAAEMLLRR